MLEMKNKKEEIALVADEDEAYSSFLDKVAAQGPIFLDDEDSDNDNDSNIY